MDDQTALLPKEVEGIHINLQSHPKSSYIEVDYDA